MEAEAETEEKGNLLFRASPLPLTELTLTSTCFHNDIRTLSLPLALQLFMSLVKTKLNPNPDPLSQP